MQHRPTVCDGLLATILVVGVVLLLAGTGLGIWAVVLASTSFVVVAAHGVWQERSALAICLCLGLVLCWTGDVVGYLGNFELSAGSFLVGHLVFAGGFLAKGTAWRRLLVGFGAVLVAGLLIGQWLIPHLPADQRVLVMAYMVVISIMVVAACGSRQPSLRLLVVAAVLFYVSDIAVARWRFVSPGPENRFFCYPLYYTACLLLALASRWGRPVREEEIP